MSLASYTLHELSCCVLVATHVPLQTIGAAFGAKKVSVQGESVTLGIWVSTSYSSPPLNLSLQDTAGSERYESMSRIYYRGAKAAIVCFGECLY